MNTGVIWETEDKERYEKSVKRLVEMYDEKIKEKTVEAALYPKLTKRTSKEEIEHIQGMINSIFLGLQKLKNDQRINDELVNHMEDSLQTSKFLFDKHFFRNREDFN